MNLLPGAIRASAHPRHPAAKLRGLQTLCIFMLAIAGPVLAQPTMPSPTMPSPNSQAPVNAPTAAMENPANPLVLIQTTQGEIYLELFPEAAPRNVQHFLDLADARLPVPDGNPGSGNSSATPINYYDGLSFHRILSNTLIQAGAPERVNRMRPTQTVADEINARGLGLEQQRVLDDSGRPHQWLNIGDRTDFQEKVLLPLYRSMNIRNEADLQSQQSAILQRLQSMNLLQLHELQGYRYDGNLPSRRPVRGSVMMVNRGPGTNDGEFFITLTDTPWLTGSSTVIGRVVQGMAVAEQIGSSAPNRTRINQLRQVNIVQSQTGE